MRNSTKSTSPDQPVRGNGAGSPPLAGDAFDNLDRIQAEGSDTTGTGSAQGDIFDNLDKIRLDPAALQINTTKQLLHVPARKPRPQEFFRVHPDPAMSIVINGLYDDDERENYVVLPGAEELVKRFVKPVQLVVCVNRQGSLFVWPVPLPASDRRGGNSWATSARAGMEMAKTKWISLRSDMDARAYEAEVAKGSLPEPVWPDKTLPEILRLAYGKGKIIDSIDHPKVQDFLGLV
jgi:hypothetical protein